ncbi:MAG: RIO1 family regulatory kinase/ATPase [Nitrososphaeria archaeon]
MSTAEVAANCLRRLEERDFRILYALEGALNSIQQAKVEYLEKSTRLHRDEVIFRLERLQKNKMISKGESGYYLVSTGLDAIALKAFVKRGLISVFGGNVGVGKEADIFDVADDRGNSYVIKFYRLGRTSFREVKKKRQIIPAEESANWLKACVNAATKEMWAMRKVRAVGGVVPEAIARERHAILMQKIDGVLLNKVMVLDNPKLALKSILDTIKLAYVKAGIVNGDLSEYNILHDGERFYVIDWPQSVLVSSPDSGRLLIRDLRNVLRFFSKRFNVYYTFEKAYDYVTRLDSEF